MTDSEICAGLNGRCGGGGGGGREGKGRNKESTRSVSGVEGGRAQPRAGEMPERSEEWKRARVGNHERGGFICFVRRLVSFELH